MGEKSQLVNRRGDAEGGRKMKDITTQQLLRISSGGTGGPYITVQVEQLDDVRHLPGRHRVGHWVEKGAISLDGAPEVAVVSLGRGADAQAVQVILDSVD
jgi:hypothetical protein